MSDLKTKQSSASVETFVRGIKDEKRRREVREVIALMEAATKTRPRMWGSSIIGFGSFRYRYGSGREGEWFITGLSPRKSALTVYILPGLDGHAARLKELGKFTMGKSCLYIRNLDDIHLPTLRAMAAQAAKELAHGLDVR